MSQPIIRGIQAVGAVDIFYRYNNSSHELTIPAVLGGQGTTDVIATGESGIPIAGFRLDSEFLRANPQIASSFVIPILGGGGVALTNNNRTGTLNITCTKVSTPVVGDTMTGTKGSMYQDTDNGIGPVGSTPVYDLTYIAQVQQGQEGGDSVGSTICIKFKFNGITTKIQFEMCTIASVDPVILTGNDAAQYNISINYVNWQARYNDDSGNFIA